ncbi:MAG: lysophospholipid acyltransferase family protein [Woeseiaceae bacterium]
MTDANSGQRTTATGILYGSYVWIEFTLAMLVAILAAIFVPGVERRRRCVAFCGRLSLRLAGISTVVRGLEKLPATDCVIVSNHASYIDGVLMQGFLPSRFSFVVKGEMQSFPIVNILLRRVGCRFVERFEASGSARDARRLLKAASAGESLVVFPEGTFEETPGLGRFRAGAFAAAVRAGVPVVPAVISGSRYILPAEKLLPRRGNLRIDILNPIAASHPAFANSKALADLARQRILTVLDEPDLLPAATETKPTT